MESRLDVFPNSEDTTDPVNSLTLTRVQVSMLGCGVAILLKFWRGRGDVQWLGYCSPDELRTAMKGIDIV